MQDFSNLVLALCLVIIVTVLIQYSSEDASDTDKEGQEKDATNI